MKKYLQTIHASISLKALLILLSGVLLFGNSKAQTYVSGGIYSNTTWTLAGSPYIVTDTVVVFPGVTLTIEPGVIVKFDTTVELEIREGTLIALGTAADSITFTSNSISPVPGSWNQIYMYNTYSSVSSKFSYCNFIYAINGIYNYQSDTIFIKHSTFRDNLTGISWGCLYIDSSNFYNNYSGIQNFSSTNVLNSGSLLNACKVTNNTTGISVDVNTNSTTPNTITNDVIEFNNTGLATLMFSLVNNCVVKYNNWGITISPYGDGYPSMLQNTIIDSNKVTGISLAFNGDIITNCEINYNRTGIDDSSGFESYFGNTIQENTIDNNDYGLVLHDPAVSGEIECNSICNNSMYNLYYNGSVNTVVNYNYWCLTDSAGIQATIYDGYQNISYGLAFFTPFDTVLCTHICNMTVTASATQTMVCSGTSTILTAGVSDADPVYTVVWNPGAFTGSSYTVSPTSDITYTVVVTDSSGCIATATITIDTSCASPPPCNLTVTATATQTLVCSGSPNTLTATIIDTVPITSIVWSPSGYNGNPDIIITSSSDVTYTVVVTDNNGCVSSTTVTVDTACAAIPCGGVSPPSICYVSVDTSSTFNTVYWQKVGMDTLAIDSVIIYRQNVLGSYVPIGEVSVHAPTFYNDYTAMPLVESYFYKLGIADTCGGDTSLSNFNETVFLQSSIATGTSVANLNWNFYQGNPLTYYRVFRDDSGTGNWHAIDSVQGTINAYSDRNAPVNPGLRYMLNIDWNVVCTPFLSVYRPNHHFVFNTHDEAYSNMTYLFPTGINNILDNNSILVYPNPVNDAVSISFKNAFEGLVKVTDVLGQDVYTSTLSAESGSVKKVNVGSFANGVYFIILEENGKFYRTKIIKM